MVHPGLLPRGDQTLVGGEDIDIPTTTDLSPVLVLVLVRESSPGSWLK